MLGRGAEAAALLGLDRFLQAAPLAGLVSGFDPEAALPELEREIRSNPTLHSEGPGHATRKGLRTRNFPAVDDRACAELVGHIGAAIEGYAGRLEGDHPFVRGRPERIGLAAWALLLPAAGHQCLHVHPAGWLTGVFYVTAPPGAPRPGRLRVGGLPEWAGIAPPWPVVEIEPTPGTLVLFPSFVPHETEPTGSAADRISVAFDAGEPSGIYY